jgi:hypothetical protein
MFYNEYEKNRKVRFFQLDVDILQQIWKNAKKVTFKINMKK